MPSKLNDYDIISAIGSGSYGKCLKICRKSDGKILVWKEMDYGSMTEPEKQQLVSEVNLLRELKHQYIVRYYDRIIDRTSSRLYLVMEYCSGGDLASLISKKRRERSFLDEQFVLKVFVQLVLALQECHCYRQKSGQGKILHRDLKPANVFLDGANDVKLGDFGLARVLNHDTSFAKTFVGTPYYMSPEQMDKLSYNEKSDIWSLGCLIYELCALLPPFTASNQRLLALKIKEGKFRKIPSKYSESLQSSLMSMLDVVASRRPSIDDILKLPFLQNMVKLYGPQNIPNVPVAEKLVSEITSDIPKSKTAADIMEKERRLAEREDQYEKKMVDLERKERDIKRKERLLEERERQAEQKMATAEDLIKQYREMKLEKQLFNAKAGLKLTEEKYGVAPLKKHVHFASESKENMPIYNESDELRYKRFTSGVGPISEKNIGDYRKKLRDIRLNNAHYNRKNKIVGLR